MRRVLFVFIVSLCLLSAVYAAGQSKDGAVREDLIVLMRDSVKPDLQTRRLMDAVIKNEVREIAINTSVLKDHNPYFSHEIKSGAITDQKSTGRCWLFAGLNVLRPYVIEKIEDESFEFSQNYLFFWDKIEKANTFLEKVIERRKLNVRDDDFQRILRNPVADGGWWEYFAYLVKKYGVVPMSAMPETQSTKSSGMMDRILTHKLRENAAELRALSEKGASVEKLRRKKEEFLLEVYHILCFHLGTPPTEFTFRYKSKVDEEKKMAELVKVMNAITNGKGGGDFSETEALKEMSREKVSLLKTYTPTEFAEEYAVAKLDDYVVLGNAPLWELNKLYIMEHERNVFEEAEAGFLNVSIEDMKLATLQSVLSDEAVWFGADISQQRDNESGILHSQLYLYDDIYGTSSHFDKADKIRYQSVGTNHAMTFVGVDVVDDRPLKWKVENSWGSDNGMSGYLAMYDNWFDDYVIMAIVNKKYLPERIIALLDTKPIVIKESDPFLELMMIK